MIKYFKELLETLKKIEKHLAVLSSCVSSSPTHRSHLTAIRTMHWNDK